MHRHACARMRALRKTGKSNRPAMPQPMLETVVQAENNVKLENCWIEATVSKKDGRGERIRISANPKSMTCVARGVARGKLKCSSRQFVALVRYEQSGIIAEVTWCIRRSVKDDRAAVQEHIDRAPTMRCEVCQLR